MWYLIAPTEKQDSTILLCFGSGIKIIKSNVNDLNINACATNTHITSLSQQLNHSLLLLVSQLVREFYVELDYQITSLARPSLQRHTFSINYSSSLRRDDLVEVKVNKLSVKLFLNKINGTTVIAFESRASIREMLAV